MYLYTEYEIKDDIYRNVLTKYRNLNYFHRAHKYDEKTSY